MKYTILLSKKDLEILKYIVNNGFEQTFESCLTPGKDPFTFKKFEEFCYKVGLGDELTEIRV